MRAPVLIVGQGLAGSLLARALERRGIAFVIADAGHAGAASRVGAGIINPVTGMRMAKSAGVDAALPVALETYRDLEQARGKNLLRRTEVRRAYVDGRERAELLARLAAGRLTPYVESENETADGFVIRPAWRVDLPALIESERDSWRLKGRLSERVVDEAEVDAWDGPAVWCHGAGAAGMDGLAPAWGSLLEVECAEPVGEAILNRGGRWLLPLDGRRAWIGATYERSGPENPDAARADLERTAELFLADREYRVRALLSGVRMTTADRRPLVRYAAGRGCINGLGSKGALHAPSAAEEIAAAIAAELP